MFVKTRGYCWVTYNEKGERQRHFVNWIEFAFTPADSELLRSEPHLTGSIESCECLGESPAVS